MTVAAWALTLDAAAQTLPQPKNHVEDHAGVINQSVLQKLDRYLTELEQKTGVQMIVLTVDTTGGEPTDDFAIRQAEAWKLGQKGKDNGVLLVVAVKDRKYFTATGYGVEGVLPDSLCGAVGRQYFVPHFKRGDYSTGIYEGALALATVLAEDAGVTISGMPVRPVSRRGRAASGIPCVSSLFPLLIIFAVISSLGRRRRAYGAWGGGMSPWWLLLLLGGGRGRSFGGGWGGGGGFGGGGFGGGSFGGGGGGSFGGGGGGGGW